MYEANLTRGRPNCAISKTRSSYLKEGSVKGCKSSRLYACNRYSIFTGVVTVEEQTECSGSKKAFDSLKSGQIAQTTDPNKIRNASHLRCLLIELVTEIAA